MAVAREELHLSLSSTKLCATGGQVQLPVLWEYTLQVCIHIYDNILGKCRWWQSCTLVTGWQSYIVPTFTERVRLHAEKQ